MTASFTCHGALLVKEKCNIPNMDYLSSCFQNERFNERTNMGDLYRLITDRTKELVVRRQPMRPVPKTIKYLIDR